MILSDSLGTVAFESHLLLSAKIKTPAWGAFILSRMSKKDDFSKILVLNRTYEKIVINNCFSYSQYFCDTLKNMSELHLRKASSSFIQLTIPSASQDLYCLIRNFIYLITPVNANLCCLHHSPWGASLLRLLLA